MEISEWEHEIIEIILWLKKLKEILSPDWETARGKAFGYVKTKNGKIGQLKVMMEFDEGKWHISSHNKKED